MKMDAAYSLNYYPTDVNVKPYAMNYQQSSQENQMCCFETMIPSGNFSAIEKEDPMSTGQPQDVVCCLHERDFMDIANICNRHNLFNAMNNTDSAAVDENLSGFTESVKSEIDTIPVDNPLSTFETDIRNFEHSVKEALDSFTNELLNIVQDQTKLFDTAYNELINAISGYFKGDDIDPVAEELPGIKNTGDVAESPTTNSQAFKFEEFEITFREKFMAALDELLNGLKKNMHVYDDFDDEGVAKGYPSYSGNYAHMQEVTNPDNHGSDHETFTVLA